MNFQDLSGSVVWRIPPQSLRESIHFLELFFFKGGDTNQSKLAVQFDWQRDPKLEEHVSRGFLKSVSYERCPFRCKSQGEATKEDAIINQERDRYLSSAERTLLMKKVAEEEKNFHPPLLRLWTWHWNGVTLQTRIWLSRHSFCVSHVTDREGRVVTSNASLSYFLLDNHLGHFFIQCLPPAFPWLFPLYFSVKLVMILFNFNYDSLGLSVTAEEKKEKQEIKASPPVI